jgi:hypothetical protein
MIALIFIVAFAYVIGDTLAVGIKQKDLFKLQRAKINWKGYLRGFLFFFFLLSIVNAVLYYLMPSSILADEILMTAVHFIVILIGMKLEEKANWFHVISMGVIWIIAIIINLASFNLSSVNYCAYIMCYLL